MCVGVESECGNIIGGIALAFVEYPYPVVVDFNDFEKVYLLAKAIREKGQELRLSF